MENSTPFPPAPISFTKLTLSLKQALARDKVVDWYKSEVDFKKVWGHCNQQIFRLFGYAGTGKSTILKDVLEALACDYIVATYTGKAAQVLKAKGTPCRTIHSGLYRVVMTPEEVIKDLIAQIEVAPTDALQPLKEKLRELNQPKYSLDPESIFGDVDLIVLDEVSMVGEDIARDLLRFGVPILVLGDPGQLPPISGAGFFTQCEPDVLLDEIHRQAAESPIIHLATTVRNGGRLAPGLYGTSRVYSRGTCPLKTLLESDQVLVGRNATRSQRNLQIRFAAGRAPGLPVAGDRLICLRNDKDAGVFNGSMWNALEVSTDDKWVNIKIESLDDDYARPKTVRCHPQPFLGKDLKEMPHWLKRMALEFDYGYAITVHKAQGSQWRRVHIDNEAYIFKRADRDDSARWLYTGITRAEEEVHIAL